MIKMARPTMEILLFAGSDVIAASGNLGKLTAWDFDNVQYSDAHMIYNHVHYWDTNRQELYDILGDRTTIMNWYGEPIQIEDLYDFAYRGHDPREFARTGEYTWDESIRAWVQ